MPELSQENWDVQLVTLMPNKVNNNKKKKVANILLYRPFKYQFYSIPIQQSHLLFLCKKEKKSLG